MKKRRKKKPRRKFIARCESFQRVKVKGMKKTALIGVECVKVHPRKVTLR